MGKSAVVTVICGYGLVAGRDLPKVEAGVRFPLPAHNFVSKEKWYIIHSLYQFIVFPWIKQ